MHNQEGAQAAGDLTESESVMELPWNWEWASINHHL